MSFDPDYQVTAMGFYLAYSTVSDSGPVISVLEMEVTPDLFTHFCIQMDINMPATAVGLSTPYVVNVSLAPVGVSSLYFYPTTYATGTLPYVVNSVPGPDMTVFNGIIPLYHGIVPVSGILTVNLSDEIQGAVANLALDQWNGASGITLVFTIVGFGYYTSYVGTITGCVRLRTSTNPTVLAT